MDSLEGKMLRAKNTGPSPEGASIGRARSRELSERSDNLGPGGVASIAPESASIISDTTKNASRAPSDGRGGSALEADVGELCNILARRNRGNVMTNYDAAVCIRDILFEGGPSYRDFRSGYVAERAALSKTTVYAFAAAADRWSKAEIVEICSMVGPHGRGVLWSHLLVLAAENLKEVWRHWLEKTVTHAWRLAELKAALVAANLRNSGPKRARALTAPKSRAPSAASDSAGGEARRPRVSKEPNKPTAPTSPMAPMATDDSDASIEPAADTTNESFDGVGRRADTLFRELPSLLARIKCTPGKELDGDRAQTCAKKLNSLAPWCKTVSEAIELAVATTPRPGSAEPSKATAQGRSNVASPPAHREGTERPTDLRRGHATEGPGPAHARPRKSGVFEKVRADRASAGTPAARKVGRRARGA
jgi:hypothetical protein